jgi:hypothetical protein
VSYTCVDYCGSDTVLAFGFSDNPNEGLRSFCGLSCPDGTIIDNGSCGACEECIPFGGQPITPRTLPPVDGPPVDVPVDADPPAVCPTECTSQCDSYYNGKGGGGMGMGKMMKKGGKSKKGW